jgi:hypothetical protein
MAHSLLILAAAPVVIPTGMIYGELIWDNTEFNKIQSVVLIGGQVGNESQLVIQ